MDSHNDDSRSVGSPEPEKPTAQRAVELSRHLDIVSVRFSSFSALSFHAFEELPEEGDLRPALRFTRPSATFLGDDLTVSLTMVFFLEMHLPDDKVLKVANARATTVLKYVRRPNSPEADFGSEALNSFALFNAPFHAWGYWREFVQSCLTRLDMPTLTLPLYRVQDAPRMLMDDEQSPAVLQRLTRTSP